MNLAGYFVYTPRWYRDSPARALARGYYACLRRAVRENPRLGRCRKRCGDCGIFFFADPRNAGCRDLRCPFGCRREHHRQDSTRRAGAYYATPGGRAKKKALNRRRACPAPDAPAAQPVAPGWLLAHLCLVLRLVEGHPCSPDQVARLIQQISRQRRMATDLAAGYFQLRPP